MTINEFKRHARNLITEAHRVTRVYNIHQDYEAAWRWSKFVCDVCDVHLLIETEPFDMVKVLRWASEHRRVGDTGRISVLATEIRLNNQRFLTEFNTLVDLYANS